MPDLTKATPSPGPARITRHRREAECAGRPSGDPARILHERAETTSGADADYLLLYSAAGPHFRKSGEQSHYGGVAKTGFTNLVVANNAASPDSKLDVTAGELVLRTDSAMCATLLPLPAPRCRVLVGRRDSGWPRLATLSADTWYYLWAISDGVNDRLLLSASATSPSLPSGYPIARCSPPYG